MAIATVVKVVFGVKMKDKWDGAELHSLTSNGQKRKDFIFKRSEMYAVLDKLNPGDEIELKVVKDGQYYNLKDIIPTGNKAAAPAASSGGGAPAGGGKGGGGWVPRFSDTEEYIRQRDTSIQRQVALKAGNELVIAMLQAGMMKKSATADFLVEEVIRISNHFEGHISGEDAKTSLASSCESLDTSGGLAYDDDCPPFDVD